MAFIAKNVFSIFRISKSQYSNDIEGKGAFLYGGRWNTKGFFVIYAAESRSLAFCEFLAGLQKSIFPPNLSLTEIIIPKGILMEEITIKKLPKNWREPFSAECQKAGNEWLQNSQTAILKVPSSIIEEEFNYVINSQHLDYKKIKFRKQKQFFPDERILKKST